MTWEHVMIGFLLLSSAFQEYRLRILWKGLDLQTDVNEYMLDLVKKMNTASADPRGDAK